METIIRALIVASILVASVTSHAILVNPSPLNPNPTQASPCGVSTMPNPMTSAPSANWNAGSSVTITWRLVASDGGNAVTGWIDPNGGTNFTVQAFPSTSHGTATGTNYPIAFTVPTSIKSCPNGVCTFQVKSNSANPWVSCSMVNITECNGCPEPTPAPAVCKQSGKLNFCTDMSNRNVYVPASADPLVLDNLAKTTFNNYIVNPNVFGNNNTECRQKYKTFLCASNLPPCAGAKQTLAEGAACHGMCTSTMDTCKLTESHKALYDCEALPQCNGEGNSCSLLSAATAVSAVAALALL